MLELKTQGDCLCIGFGTLEDMVVDHQWAEKHRQLSVEAGYRVREIANPGTMEEAFTENDSFLETYQCRTIPRETLPINHLITTYNTTVAIYHTHNGLRIGLEIVSALYTETVRSIFETYWAVAEPDSVIRNHSQRG